MTRPLTAPGRLVAGRYRLVSKIGGGGMGTVWLARDELLGRQVALKQVLLPPGGQDSDVADHLRERALREGRIAARLTHPHAISVYDVALESGQPWLVMEYLPSRSLAEVLAADGVLRVDQVAQVGAQVADALAATHAAGIVHRDVKPANILIGQGGRIEGLVKITDFGISHASGDVTLTQTGQITGTPAFLAPEVAQGHEMSEASDVFSLGATLYTCLEGRPPFGMDDNALRLLHKVAGGVIDPPRRAGSLVRPLLRMLAADPAERPTMTEVRNELVKLAAGRDGDPTTVLMARTNVGSAASRRDRTAPMPPRTPAGVLDDAPAGAASGAAVGADPGTVGADPGTVGADGAGTASPAPPAPDRTLVGGTPAPASHGDGAGSAPPGDRPPAEEPPSRRSRTAVWLAVAAAATVLAIALGAWWLSSAGDDPTQTASRTGVSEAAPTPDAPPTEASPAATQEEPAGEEPTAEEPTGEESASSAPPVEPQSSSPEQTLENYYAALPGDTEAAYAMTGPYLRSVASFDYYQDFFSPFSEVSLVDVRDVEDLGDVVTATTEVEFVERDGSRSVEQHAVRFVRDDDGRLLIDRDVFVAPAG